MKSLFKSSASVFGRVVFANVICIFISLTVSVLCTALFTHNIGYVAYGTKSSDSSEVASTASSSPSEKLYTYYSADGDDTKKAEYEAEGYTVSTQKLRSDMSKGGRIAFLIINQIFCLFILNTFIYSEIWHLGTTDNNKVHFGRIKEDKFKGIKIGALAAVPFIALYFVFVVLKFAYPAFPVIIYKFLNCSFFSLIDVAFGSAATVGELNILRLFLTLVIFVIIPLLCQFAYTLGYKQISLGEKFIYKKKKDK